MVPRLICLGFAVVFVSVYLVSSGLAYEVTVGIESVGDSVSRENYILSEDGGVIAGVVSNGVTIDKGVSGGYTELTEDGAGNSFYVFLTQGTRENLVSRIGYVLDGSFDAFYSPSFGFELVGKRNLVLRAVYETMNIIGAERMSSGNYNLIVRYDSIVGGVPQITVATMN